MIDGLYVGYQVPMCVCPTCGSSSTISVPILFAQGISDLSALGVGIDFGAQIILGAAFIGGQQQSLLSRLLSPPTKATLVTPLFVGIAIWLFLSLTITGSTVGAIVGIAIAALLLGYSVMYNSRTWPALFDRWSDSLLCQKCGTVFTHD